MMPMRRLCFLSHDDQIALNFHLVFAYLLAIASVLPYPMSMKKLYLSKVSCLQSTTSLPCNEFEYVLTFHAPRCRIPGVCELPLNRSVVSYACE